MSPHRKKHILISMIGIPLTKGTKLVTPTGNGKPKSLPEKLATDTAETLIRDIDLGGCVDDQMQDQVILFMALAQGVSRIRTGQ